MIQESKAVMEMLTVETAGAWLSLFIEKPRKLALAGLFIWIGAVVRKAGTSRSDGYNPSSNADSWRVMIVWLLRRS